MQLDHQHIQVLLPLLLHQVVPNLTLLLQLQHLHLQLSVHH
jgi:hypothetical protein